MPQFSIIVPVYNRPDEARELLESLTKSVLQNFEVVIVEDGSTETCEAAIQPYFDKLPLKYFVKQNEGPGLTRNYGAHRASGDYFIFFDSDCLIPTHYMEAVTQYLRRDPVDCFGGPDKAHPSFTPVQKAISYSMTAFLTTGGIRGGKKKMDVFHPRSFNMGFSRKVFEKTLGYSNMRFGEDLDMSLRILKEGFRTALIPDAFVYHKRRTSFRKFFKQVHNSGIARINLYKRHPNSLKAVHFAPALFVLFALFAVVAMFFGLFWPLGILLLYSLALFVDAYMVNEDFQVAFLSVQAAWVQHFGYGLGFLKAFWKRIILRQGEFHAYKKNFYK